MKKLIFRAVLGLLLSGSLLLAGTVLAAALPVATDINQTVIISPNGKLLLDGQRSSKMKLDILKDKYVWRYEPVNKPGLLMNSVAVTVRLPSTVTTSQTKPTMFAVHGIDDYRVTPVDDHSFLFEANGIGPEATVTLTIDLPTTALHLGSFEWVQAKIAALSATGWLIIALVVPILMLIAVGAFLVVRAPDMRLTPSTEPQNVPPSQLSPALVGVLMNGYVGTREIAATLIDLAKRGYIDIIYRSDGDFGFSQKRVWQQDPALHDFERFFLGQLFQENSRPVTNAGQISQQLEKDLWSDSISQAIERIYAQMEQLGYFTANPKRSHQIVRFAGMLVFFISVIGLGISLYFFNTQPLSVLPWIVSLILSPIITRLSLLVPQRTPAGREQARRWLAFRQAMMLPQPVKYSDEGVVYEQYLTYAVVLDAERAWTSRFGDIGIQLPNWFFTQGNLINTYPEFAAALFSIISFVSQKFSFSRKPTAA